MLRQLIAVVIGLAAAVIILAAWQVLVYGAMPQPTAVGERDLRQVPSLTLFVLLVGYCVAAATGGGVAARLAGERATLVALAVGGVQTVVAIGNLFSIAHPLWFVLVSPFVHLPAAWAGACLQSSSRKLRS